MRGTVSLAARTPASLLILGSIGILAATVVSGASPAYALPVVALTTVVAVGHRVLFRWRNLLLGLAAVILFIPIRRYTVAGNLPFQLEPYRLFVMFLAVGWLASLLVDWRVRLRSSPFDGPLFLILVAAIVSDAANPHRVSGLTGDVVKSLTFFISFLVVYYLFVSVLLRFVDVDAVIKMLVGGGAVLAALGLVEAGTGFNAFDHLHPVMPFLHANPAPYLPETIRGGRLRIVGSAQHPIALSALFVMLLPLSVYVARATSSRRWLLAAGLLVLGVFATESRTGIVMLLVVLGVYLRLRPQETRRLWRYALPALVVIHLVVPGSIGALKESFFPSGGLVAQEQAGAGTHGSGRLADLGPSLAEWRVHPLFGQGYGTRIPELGPKHNASILDDQWLGTLLETGVLGMVAWIWLFGRVYRRTARAAREDRTERGWLFVAVAASTLAFGVGMATYDAFSFIQVTFAFFMLIAIAAAALRASTPRAVR